MSTKKLCIDIDNVIAETDAVMRMVIKKYSSAGVELAYTDIVFFEYWKCRDKKGKSITRDEWKEIHKQFSKEKYIINIKPVHGARKYLRCLQKEGYELHIVTSRLPIARIATIKWLEKHSIPDHRLHFVEHGEKHVIFKDFDAAIEDDREQAKKFLKMGVKTFLLAHPWNKIKKGNKLIRVQNWKQLYNKLHR